MSQQASDCNCNTLLTREFDIPFGPALSFYVGAKEGGLLINNLVGFVRVPHYIFTVLVGGFLLSSAAHATDQSKAFIFCYENTELYPSFVGDSSEVPETKPGFAIDLMKLIGKEVDLEMNFVRFPWKRCLALMKAGAADGVIASFSKSRMAIGRYPMLKGKPDEDRRFYTGGYRLYQMKGQPTVWDGENFNFPNVTIGVPLGYSIVEKLRSQGLNVIEAGNIEGMMTMLQRGRVDAVAAPGLSTDALIKRYRKQYADIERQPLPLQIKAYYVMLSHQFVKKTPGKATAIWEAARRFRQDVTDELMKQY